MWSKCSICTIAGVDGGYDDQSFWPWERHCVDAFRVHMYVKFDVEQADKLIQLTKPVSDTPKQARFRKLIRSLLASGVKPTPTEIMNRQGRNKYVIPTSRQAASYSGPCFHGGDLTRVRREEFVRAGWRPDERTGRWQKPPLT